MADGKQEAAGEEKGGGLGKALLLGVGAVVLVGIGAAGAHFAGPRLRTPEPEAEASEVETPAAADERRAADIADRLLPLEPVVVNLGGSGPPRYLKATLELEIAPDSSRDSVEKAMPVVRDAILVLLSSQRLADLQAFEGKVLLKEEILDRVNGALGEPMVDAVLFTEFIVQ